jgi:hypothetical protein
MLSDTSLFPITDRSDELRKLYSGGLTLRELGEHLGCSQETARRRMIASGIARRPRGQPIGKHLPSGGRTIDKSGYVLVANHGHPQANRNGCVREHRLVTEMLVGRLLQPEEVVHHCNGIKSDNRPENLQLFASNSEHKRQDMLGNQWAKNDFGNPKRRVHVRRSPEAIRAALRKLAASLDRPIRRTDLRPPHPSYRAVARAFGSWRAGVEAPLSEECRESPEPAGESISSRLEAA